MIAVVSLTTICVVAGVELVVVAPTVSEVDAAVHVMEEDDATVVAEHLDRITPTEDEIACLHCCMMFVVMVAIFVPCCMASDARNGRKAPFFDVATALAFWTSETKI